MKTLANDIYRLAGRASARARPRDPRSRKFTRKINARVIRFVVDCRDPRAPWHNLRPKLIITPRCRGARPACVKRGWFMIAIGCRLWARLDVPFSMLACRCNLLPLTGEQGRMRISLSVLPAAFFRWLFSPSEICARHFNHMTSSSFPLLFLDSE